MEPQASAHNDPNSNPGKFQVDPQLMEFLDRKFQESLQHKLGAFQQVAWERFADAEAGWMKTIQQNKEREALLKDQVDDLRRQLEASRKAALALPRKVRCWTFNQLVLAHSSAHIVQPQILIPTSTPGLNHQRRLQCRSTPKTRAHRSP